ncbi:zinc finger, PHD-type containing protein [Tanacetum coccineum]
MSCEVRARICCIFFLDTPYLLARYIVSSCLIQRIEVKPVGSSSLTKCLNDLSYIPPNIEQNEPTQGDIGETSHKPTQAKHNEFEELYASANKELYLGCDFMTRLDFMTKFTHLKVKGKLTDSIFNEMLEFFQEAFPTKLGYKLPPSYYEIKKTFKMVELGYESIHACVNDCFLFRGPDNKDMHFCPVCKTSRWKDNNTTGKKVPKKVLRYFSIIPRLQRLYKSNHTTKQMTWHATGKSTENGKMQHPVDGKAWKNFDTRYPGFAVEPRSVQLWLADDGFNPFGNLSQSYNMWLRPLIDDLKDLWALKGVETTDAATGKPFNMRAMLLWTINDFTARSSLSGWRGEGYMTCPTCNEDIPSMRLLSKIAYVGHRIFLKKPHKRRRSLKFNGNPDDRDPPRKFTRDEILTQLDRLPTREKGKHPSYGGVKIKRNESFLGTLLMNDKSKYTTKARQDLKNLGIRRVKLPDGFGSNFKHKVTDNDSNITSMKSHDCHIMMQLLLPYELQQYLDIDVAKPIIELCSFFKQICSRTLMEDDMVKAESQLVDILCNLEQIYPPDFFDIMIYLVIHLPQEALEGGPIPYRWMYPFERYMKKLKNYVQNKVKPEGSIAEGYVAEEALTSCSHYFWDVTTKFDRPGHNVDCPPPTCLFQVFRSICRSVGKQSVIRLDHQELKNVISYILHNSPEIDTYLAKFKSSPSSNTKFICIKNDGDIIFIELIKKYDDPSEEELEEDDNVVTGGELGIEYFDKFLTRSELVYHKYLMCASITSLFLRIPIIVGGSPLSLKIPCNIGHVHVGKAYIDLKSPINIMTRMQYNWIMRKQLEPREDPESLRGIRIEKFTNEADEIAYKMPRKIEQFDSLADMEKEHTQSVYFRNEEDKRGGVNYLMNKILGFYK